MYPTLGWLWAEITMSYVSIIPGFHQNNNRKSLAVARQCQGVGTVTARAGRSPAQVPALALERLHPNVITESIQSRSLSCRRPQSLPDRCESTSHLLHLAVRGKGGGYCTTWNSLQPAW